MKCPACKDVVLSMSERQGVEIDFCPQCRGVWLDRGELDKIIEKSFSHDEQQAPTKPATAPPPPQQQGFYSEKQHSEYYGKQKRRKSFLEEIFD